MHRQKKPLSVAIQKYRIVTKNYNKAYGDYLVNEVLYGQIKSFSRVLLQLPSLPSDYKSCQQYHHDQPLFFSVPSGGR